jgi:hypothetical protein
MGTTPIYSFPYPEPTDLVRNGPQDFEDLALAVETTIDTLPEGVILNNMNIRFSSAQYIIPGWAFTNTTVSLSTDRTNAFAIAVPFSTVVTAAALEVTTASAGTIRIALFESESTFQRPTVLIEDFGTVTTGTTGVKEITFGAPRTLDPGLYWLVTAHTGTPTLTGAGTIISCPTSSATTNTGNPVTIGIGRTTGGNSIVTSGFTNLALNELTSSAQIVGHVRLKTEAAL